MQTVTTLKGHGCEQVVAVAFDRSGERALTAGDDGTVRVWNVATGKRTKTAHVAEPYGLGAACFAVVDEDRAWVSTGEKAFLVDLGTGELVDDAPFSAVAAHASGTFAHVSGGALIVVDAGATRAMLGDVVAPTNLAFDDTGKLLAGVGPDHTIHVWQAHSGEHLHGLVGHGLPLVQLGWTPDGRLVSASYDGTVRRWSLDDGSCLAPEPGGPIVDLHVIGAQLIVSQRDGAAVVQRTCSVEDVGAARLGPPQHRYAGPFWDTSHDQWHAREGSWPVFGAGHVLWAEPARLACAGAGAQTSLPAAGAFPCAVGRHAAAFFRTETNELAIWRFADDSVVELGVVERQPSVALFDADCTRLVARVGKRLSVWDARGGSLVKSKASSPAARYLRLCGDGSRLLLGGAVCRLWDTDSLRPLHDIAGGLRGFTFAPTASWGAAVDGSAGGATLAGWGVGGRSLGEPLTLEAPVGTAPVVVFGEHVFVGHLDGQVSVARSTGADRMPQDEPELDFYVEPSLTEVRAGEYRQGAYEDRHRVTLEFAKKLSKKRVATLAGTHALWMRAVLSENHIFDDAQVAAPKFGEFAVDGAMATFWVSHAVELRESHLWLLERVSREKGLRVVRFDVDSD